MLINLIILQQTQEFVSSLVIAIWVMTAIAQKDRAMLFNWMAIHISQDAPHFQFIVHHLLLSSTNCCSSDTLVKYFAFFDEDDAALLMLITTWFVWFCHEKGHLLCCFRWLVQNFCHWYRFLAETQNVCQIFSSICACKYLPIFAKYCQFFCEANFIFELFLNLTIFFFWTKNRDQKVEFWSKQKVLHRDGMHIINNHHLILKNTSTYYIVIILTKWSLYPN